MDTCRSLRADGGKTVLVDPTRCPLSLVISTAVGHLLFCKATLITPPINPPPPPHSLVSTRRVFVSYLTFSPISFYCQLHSLPALYSYSISHMLAIKFGFSSNSIICVDFIKRGSRMKF